MKTILPILSFILWSTSIMSQDLYAVVESEIKFYSDSPVEKIEAVNKKTKSFFKVSTKTLMFVIPIVSFKFEKPLMEEHFNENYLESEKFPTAKFSGTINENIDYSKDGVYEASATGKLTIHGVEQERIITGTITIKDGQLIFEGKFDIKLIDHDIDIPSIVIQNIAEIVAVTAKFVYEPKK
ncbi:MAG: YceI family protein [Flavobacteriales bacterium]|nr:YceI family protein [Flavobacteriales bacterium]